MGLRSPPRDALAAGAPHGGSVLPALPRRAPGQLTRVYSVGTSNRTAGEFLALLASKGIRALADVRRFPDSARLLHFRRAALEAALRGEGIGYASFAEELGGFREGGYAPHARSAAFAEGIRRLAALAREAPTAFCCAERDPRSCHRRFVAEALEGEGLEAVHLLGPGREARHGDLFRERQGRLFEGA